jgi:cytochrome P450
MQAVRYLESKSAASGELSAPQVPKGDLVADLAYDLPALTILTLLGVEPEKVAEVKRWAKSRVLLTWGNVSDVEQVAHAENLVAYWNYCLAVVAVRHVERMDDLPGDFVALQRDGVEITDHEIASFCYSLLSQRVLRLSSA